MRGIIKRILFDCVANSNRSQTAEALAPMHGAGQVGAHSSGSLPSGRTNPKAVETMEEREYDLTTHTSIGLTGLNGRHVDVAVTMACGDECPLVVAARRVDWKIPVPRDMTSEHFRVVGGLNSEKVKALPQELTVAEG